MASEERVIRICGLADSLLEANHTGKNYTTPVYVGTCMCHTILYGIKESQVMPTYIRDNMLNASML